MIKTTPALAYAGGNEGSGSGSQKPERISSTAFKEVHHA